MSEAAFDGRYLAALNAICRPIRAAEYPRSLEPLRALLEALGHPQADFPSVVMAGSVGKGTAACHIAHLLQACGLRAGLYSSPHLHSFRERFAINGALMTPDDFVAGVAAVEAAARKAALTAPYSTFESATALALWWFARARIEIAVLEVGLGGRDDAVNSVENVLAVFTPIEHEHAAMLGGSLESIAGHKAGVIRRGGHAISAGQSAAARDVLRREAERQRATLRFVDGGDLPRAALASLIERGVITCRAAPSETLPGLPGRMEWIQHGGRAVLIDGGHTPSAARRLRAAVMARAPWRVCLVIGMLNDKNAAGFLRVFDAPGAHLIVTRAPGPRAAAPQHLRAQFAARHATVDLVDDLQAALTAGRDGDADLTVVTGSLRMAAAAREAYGLLSAAELAEARATRAIFDGAAYLARLHPV